MKPLNRDKLKSLELLEVHSHLTGPGNIPTNVISGFFGFWGFISAEFLGIKCPHMYSDLVFLVPYTRIMDTTF